MSVAFDKAVIIAIFSAPTLRTFLILSRLIPPMTVKGIVKCDRAQLMSLNSIVDIGVFLVSVGKMGPKLI